MPEASEEAIGPYVFKINSLCVISGYKNDEDGQPSTIVMKEVKGRSP